jgi:hypothetical protein
MRGEAVVATHLLQAGVAINTIGTRLGHASLQTAVSAMAFNSGSGFSSRTCRTGMFADTGSVSHVYQYVRLRVLPG